MTALPPTDVAVSRSDHSGTEHRHRPAHGDSQPASMINLLMTMIRDWPTTWRTALLMVVSVGLLVIALWLLPIELTAGPVTIRRVR